MASLYLGLMSGTSLDGIDVALVRIEEADGRPQIGLKAFHTIPYETEQRRAIADLVSGESVAAAGPRAAARLNRQLGEWFADAALELLGNIGLKPEELTAVGSHGQTVWHEPPDDARPGATLQLGEPAVIAERLGVPVISDFRARDVAAGGHGAPLVPVVDQLLFSHALHPRALQNIGGIANVTFLPRADVKAASSPVVAFDTGPGVAVIDGVVENLTGGASRFDVDGKRAASAEPSEELLEHLMSDPYFAARPPKSTGREYFGTEFARRMIKTGRSMGVTDDNVLVATATALTARSIADAYRRFAPVDSRPEECFVSGGGARNPTLMKMLALVLDPIRVHDLAALGWDSDAKEAAAFAVLAYLFRKGRSANLPSATGAAGPRILGKLTPA